MPAARRRRHRSSTDESTFDSLTVHLHLGLERGKTSLGTVGIGGIDHGVPGCIVSWIIVVALRKRSGLTRHCAAVLLTHLGHDVMLGVGRHC
jgi:hypothetical protein